MGFFVMSFVMSNAYTPQGRLAGKNDAHRPYASHAATSGGCGETVMQPGRLMSDLPGQVSPPEVGGGSGGDVCMLSMLNGK